MRPFTIAFALLTIGCGPEVYEPPTWTPVTTEAVENDLAFEVGVFDGDQSVAILETLTGNSGEALVAHIVTPILGPYLDKTASQSGESTDTYATEEGKLTSGTAAAWIRFSCPGSELDAPTLDFSEGYVQLDGSNLVYGDTSVLENALDLLLSFETCALGEFNVTGRIPALVDMANGVVAMRTQLNFLVDGVTTELDIPMLIDNQGISFPLQVGQSKFRITLESLDEGSIRYAVQASNGSFDCQVNLDGLLECVSPIGGTFTTELY